jgi:deoxyribodipyrimidine photo-lyase
VGKEVNIFWFRRDLRLEDNAGFYKAIRGKYPVLPLFIFDPNILEKLPKNDARVSFIHTTLLKLKSQLKEAGSDLAVFYENPMKVIQALQSEFSIQHVIANHDYEPYGIRRDQEMATYLKTK